MIGRAPRCSGRDLCVAETRPGGLSGAYNITTSEWLRAQGAGGWTGDLLNLSASGRDRADVIRRSLKAAQQQVTFQFPVEQR